ncbi:MAG: VWA domain-containing protein [Candidatus Omnitrophota bacterium]
MRFADPNFIINFLIISALIIFYIIAFRLRRKTLEKFAQKELLADLMSSVDLKKQKLKTIFIILGVLFSLFALMRPQWGFRWEEVRRRGLDIIIALDVSKSMLSEDVKPDRLERSKLAIKDLVKNVKSDRLGLIAFAGSAFLQCPLTVDYSGFLLSLDSLSTDTIPKGGTSISSAIKEAMGSFEGGEKKYKVLIIITDGEDHEGNPYKLAEEAKKQGIIIYCIGIGTKEGDLIPVEEGNKKVFLKDREGNVVKTRLDEASLQQIALVTGGSYIHATNREFGLDLLYKEKLSKMEKREFEGKMAKHYEERFQIPLFLALIFFLTQVLISERRRRE